HVPALQQVGGAARGGAPQALGGPGGLLVDLVAHGADLEPVAQGAERRPVLPAPARPQADHTYAQRARHRSSALCPRGAGVAWAGRSLLLYTDRGRGTKEGLLLPLPGGQRIL